MRGELQFLLSTPTEDLVIVLCMNSQDYEGTLLICGTQTLFIIVQDQKEATGDLPCCL